MGYASITLLGNVGRDAELRYTANGIAQATFSLAVNRKKEDETQWWNVTLWREQAEKLAQHITKGKTVLVVGDPRERKWKSDDGVEHRRMEVHANVVQFAGSPDRDSKPRQDAPPADEPPW